MAQYVRCTEAAKLGDPIRRCRHHSQCSQQHHGTMNFWSLPFPYPNSDEREKTEDVDEWDRHKLSPMQAVADEIRVDPFCRRDRSPRAKNNDQCGQSSTKHTQQYVQTTVVADDEQRLYYKQRHPARHRDAMDYQQTTHGGRKFLTRDRSSMEEELSKPEKHQSE